MMLLPTSPLDASVATLLQFLIRTFSMPEGSLQHCDTPPSHKCPPYALTFTVPPFVVVSVLSLKSVRLFLDNPKGSRPDHRDLSFGHFLFFVGNVDSPKRIIFPSLPLVRNPFGGSSLYSTCSCRIVDRQPSYSSPLAARFNVSRVPCPFFLIQTLLRLCTSFLANLIWPLQGVLSSLRPWTYLFSSMPLTVFSIPGYSQNLSRANRC